MHAKYRGAFARLLQESKLNTPDKNISFIDKPLWKALITFRSAIYLPEICTASVFNQSISPHSLRHTKGMHLLQGGVSLDITRDFLGHVDIKTTEIYARANLEMKRTALEKVTPVPIYKLPSWKENKSLLK